MSVIVIVVGLLVTAVGLLGLASPERLLRFVDAVQTPAGLWGAAALRVALGVALWIAAPDSRAPALAQALGVFALLAGIATPIVGLERAGRLLAWWRSQGTGFLRGWCVFAVAFGLLLVYLVTP